MVHPVLQLRHRNADPLGSILWQKSNLFPAIKIKSRFPKKTIIKIPGSYQLVHHLRDLLISDTSSHTTIEDLARAHRISVTRFQKIFKKLYGTSIYQYVKQYRLEQATIELTNSARSITDIALDAGFSSASKFGESFKKRYGVTPTEYRLQFRDRNGIIELNQNI